MMWVCRSRPRRLPAFSFFSTSHTCSTSTTASPSPATVFTSQPAGKTEDSIFTTPESPWDHVFSDIEPVPPPTTTRRLFDEDGAAAALAPLSNRKKRQPRSQTQPIMQRSSEVKQRRASMTAREMSVFDEMFDMIFSAVSARGGKKPAAGRTTPSATATPPSVPSSSGPSFLGQTASIGGTGAPLNDLFRTLRRRTSRVRWTTAIDEELDRKKETMELFNTDHDLLQWVGDEVFGPAQQWEGEVKNAMAAPTAGTKREGSKRKDAAATSPTGPDKYSIYPHLIAHAMRVFRVTYSNPSLSLAIFEHAARVSIPSYVFGCTAPVYNELIEAKWEGWGDLDGVCNALEEMKANGVKIDGKTRAVVEKIRREVGEARPTELGLEAAGENIRAKDVNPFARRVWEALGETEVMRLVHRIEQLVLRDRSRKSTSTPHDESWKSAALQSTESDGWTFDGWGKTGDAKKQHRKATCMSRHEIRSRTPDDWTVSNMPEEMAFR